MIKTALRFGIPDIELSWIGGGTVNPGCFAGHMLAVLFCPRSARGEAAELADYHKFSKDLSDYGCWLLSVSGLPASLEPDPQRAMARDVDGSAWTAFKDIAPENLKLDRQEGATFLFGRGGSPQQVWSGPGHAAEVLDEVSGRSPAMPELAVDSRV